MSLLEDRWYLLRKKLELPFPLLMRSLAQQIRHKFSGPEKIPDLPESLQTASLGEQLFLRRHSSGVSDTERLHV